MNISQVINYFRDCYFEDNNRSVFGNIFAPDVKDRIFTEDEEELLTGALPKVYVDLDKALAAQKNTTIYRKERDFLYCSLFIVGTIPGHQGKPQAVCAPVFYQPAVITESDSEYYLELKESPVLNSKMVDSLPVNNENGALSEKLAEVLDLENEALTYPVIARIVRILEAEIPSIDCRDAVLYPKLKSEKSIKAIFGHAKKATTTKLTVVPASTTALVTKSLEIRGVINELNEIVDSNEFSTPLHCLFGAKPIEKTEWVPIGRVPAVLSNAQINVLKSGATYPLSLVIGPPGTGKSFTIAALAMEHLSRGQSVLIASKMNHAVDVVGKKIEDQLGMTGCVVRGGRKQYREELKRYLTPLLSGYVSARRADDESPETLERLLSTIEKFIRRLEKKIGKTNHQEIKFGKTISREPLGWWDALKRRLVEFRAKRVLPLWTMIETFERELQTITFQTGELIKLNHRRRLEETLMNNRGELTKLLSAIKSRSGAKKEKLFESINFSVLFKAFPIWLTNLSDVHAILPLEKELFDLAIIDEATQCDIASCIPILQRAKRVVITGDPNQLRHISFLSKSRLASLFQAHDLPESLFDTFNYRNQSILDLVNQKLPSQENVMFLDEHFRSVPSLINFSNKMFYGGNLKVMTEKPGKAGSRHLYLHQCGGTRNAKGVNTAEANKIRDDIADLINREKDLSREICHSIGVLSPFRNQVDYLSDMLFSELGETNWTRHDIMVGTAHTFQGEERDIMFLSKCVDEQSPHGSFRFLEKTDVFNVSITRSRLFQHVYASVDPEGINRKSLLKKFLEYAVETAEQESEFSTAAPRCEDPFANEVSEELIKNECRIVTAYPIAGLTMDLVAIKNNISCGIDLIGYPGQFEPAFPLERYKMFHRAGLKLIPLPYSKWLINKEQCLATILKTFQ